MFPTGERTKQRENVKDESIPNLSPNGSAHHTTHAKYIEPILQPIFLPSLDKYNKS